MKTIDLRSDTVTKPSEAMRRAMYDAEVGDDVYGEDPTVRRLEERAAEIAGKQAALFVPSGTMGNTTAIAVHCRPGHEIICDGRAHIVLYEVGMAARFAGCLTRPIPTPDGLLRWEQVAELLRPASDHFLGTGLVAIENTHNIAGGRVYPLERVRELAAKAHEAGVPVHMDGARIFDAATALGLSVGEMVEPVDSVMFCLSKGLGAPVGSMLAGGADFIAQARLIRKSLGGGMRQAGVLAAAGLVALEEGPPLLEQVHANASFLASEIRQMAGVELDPPCVETNILFFRVTKPSLTATELRERLRERGVLVSGAERIRLVTHRDLGREDCERAVVALREAMAA